MQDLLGGIELGQEVGRGATGVVYRAVDAEGRDVALKVLHPQLATDPTVVGRFVQERQIFGRIRHRNVVEVTDLIADADRLGVAMEFVEGGTLAEMVARERISATEAVRLAAEVADGLEAIHASGAVHRDLKPANVLLGGSPDALTPKIADFGLSRLLGNSISRLSGAIGTPLYMSPEVAMGTGNATGASDVYALGVMLFEMLTGRPPFEGDNPLAVARKHAEETPPQLDGVPAELQSLMSRLLSKEPGNRPSPAGAAVELRAMMGGLAEAGTVGSRPVATSGGSSLEPAPMLGATPTGVARSTPPPEPAPLYASSPPASRRASGSDVTLDEIESPLLHRSGDAIQTPIEPHDFDIGERPASVRLRVVAATLVGLLAVLVGYLLLGSGDDGVESADGVGYAFVPKVVDGAVLARTWTLNVAEGTIDVDVLVTNGGDEEIADYVHREVLPPSVPDLSAIQFAPPADQIDDEGGFARFDLGDIGPGDQVGLDYSFPAGDMEDRDDLAAAALAVAESETLVLERSGSATVELISLELRPTRLRLEVGQERELTLVGEMSDGSAADEQVLADAEWAIVDESVAVKSEPRTVLATGDGTTRLVAVAGELRSNEVEIQVGPDGDSDSSAEVAGPGASPTTSNPRVTPSSGSQTTLPNRPSGSGFRDEEVSEGSVQVSFTSSSCATAEWTLDGRVAHTSPGWPDATARCWRNHATTFEGLGPGSHRVSVVLIDEFGQQGSAGPYDFVVADEPVDLGPFPVQIVSGVSIGHRDHNSFQFSYRINGVCASGSFQVSGPGVNKTWTGDGTCFDSDTHGGFPQPQHSTFGGFDLQPSSTYTVVAWVDGVPTDGNRPGGTGRDSVTFQVTTRSSPTTTPTTTETTSSSTTDGSSTSTSTDTTQLTTTEAPTTTRPDTITSTTDSGGDG